MKKFFISLTLLLFAVCANAQDSISVNNTNVYGAYAHKWSFLGQVGFGSSSSYSSLNLQIGGMYHFNDMFALTVSAEYDMPMQNDYKGYAGLPVTLRCYTLKHSQVDVIPYVGIEPIYSLDAKKIYSGGEAGIDFILWGFRIGGDYTFPISGDWKGRYHIHLGYGFSI